jgi:hypothetical protein
MSHSFEGVAIEGTAARTGSTIFGGFIVRLSDETEVTAGGAACMGTGHIGIGYQVQGLLDSSGQVNVTS